MSQESTDSPTRLSRRELAKVALGGAAGLTLLTSSKSALAVVRPQPLGIKLGSSGPAEPTDEDLLFFKQLGVDVVQCSVGGRPELNSVEGLLKIKKRYADAGLTLHNVRNLPVTNNRIDCVLNGPGRDADIANYKTWLRNVGGAGLHYTLTNFNVAQVVTSALVETRGSRTRAFDVNAPKMGLPQASAPRGLNIMGGPKDNLYGREYTREEIWANLISFLKEVMPVAEEAGVIIGLHPDDPPVPSLFGVPRVLWSLDDYTKLFSTINSPNLGICLCVGTWAQGGAAMGIDPAGAIRYFGGINRIHEIHYRNVSSTQPHFHETYVDDGYYDMYKAMKALVDVKYNGVVHLDHAVPMVGGNRTYEAFAMGYMKAMRQRALAGNDA
ncbi:MAG: TIM barrel protein [Luteitalea sp.]|nr:TIM barrel protein [Luteitalea sp.]